MTAEFPEIRSLDQVLEEAKGLPAVTAGSPLASSNT